MNSTIAELISKRRDKLAIAAEITEAAKKGITKTQVMYQANLSFNQLNQYLATLISSKIIEVIKVQGKDNYKTTKKGKEFLQKYKEIMELISDEKTYPPYG